MPERKPRWQNGAAVLIGILIAGVVAGVFMLQQSGDDMPAASLTRPGSSGSPTSANPGVTPAPTAPSPTSTAPSERDYVETDQEPKPLPDNAEPPEEYEACVDWYESYDLSADNCASPDPEMESLMAEASKRVEAAKIPLPPPAVSPTTAAQINLQKCREFYHLLGLDPEDCSKIPDIEYIDAEKKFALEAGCSRDPMDRPGVTICGGDGGEAAAESGEPDIESDGDGGIDSVKSFAPPDWSIDGDFFGGGDADSRGLEWGGGTIVVELTTDARATWLMISDKYGRPLAPDEDSPASRTLRATLPAGQYIVRTGTDAKSGRMPYRLTLKAG